MEEGKAVNVIKVEFSYSPLIHVSMQQNNVEVLHQLLVENVGEHALREVKVMLEATPEFGETVPIEIGCIAAGQQVRLDALKCTLSEAFLSACTEEKQGMFRLTITAEGTEVFQQMYPVDILAYDQWCGVNVHPELLAAFVVPGREALQSVLRRASVILEQWTGQGTLDEYQSRNPDRVRKQMAALYAALAERGLTGYEVMLGYTHPKQRVRPVDVVLAEGTGSYLDVALLYASCLEAVGIHPLLVVTGGRVVAGAWLVRETCSDSVVDDVALLTKRTAEGVHDMTLVDTALLSVAHRADFDRAVAEAEGQLTDEASFVWALDVKRARFSGIRPLPQWEHMEAAPVWESSILPDEKPIHEAPQNINPYELPAANKEIVLTKQMLWERHLLDLSLRNSLLNTRITKNILQLIPADPALLEDKLAQGTEFSVLHKPTDWEGAAPAFGLHPLVPAADPIQGFVQVELEQKRLRSYQTVVELEKSLTHLYRSSRTSLEENGANSLYLALGLLKWYETPVSERPRYAPVLLLPVELVRRSVAKGYIIRSREEEIMVNVTLLEMLRQNFGIVVQGLDPLPSDENGVDVRQIYSLLRGSIKEQPKWEVEEQVLLGVFSFNKFIMWNDIHNNSEKLAQNKIVSSLIHGKIEWNVKMDEADAAVLDKRVSPEQLVLPIGADSSQLEAIYEAMNDRTFILHGPPGTGKSQTITNIIVNALYQGKRVLFVAEKMAALSVVQNRLAALGLAPFCLEVHSNKTKKSAVMAQLKDTAELVRHSSPENYKREAQRLLALRKELGSYVDKLHKKYALGWSLYDAMVNYQALPDVEEPFELPVELLDNRTPEDVLQWEEAIDELMQAGDVYGHPCDQPLKGLQLSTYSAAFKEEVAALLARSIEGLLRMRQALGQTLALLGLKEGTCRRDDLQWLTKMIHLLLQIPELTDRLMTLRGLSETLDEYAVLVEHGRERDRLKAKIVCDFRPEVLELDVWQLQIDWQWASKQWFLPRYLGQRKVKKLLSRYALKSVNSEKVDEYLLLMTRCRKEMEMVHGYREQLGELFGRYGRNEDWENIEKSMDMARALHMGILSYQGDMKRVSTVKQRLAAQLTEGIRTFRELHGQKLMALANCVEELAVNEQQLTSRLGVNVETLYAGGEDWIYRAVSQLQQWRNNLDRMKECYQWTQIRNRMESLGILSVFETYQADTLPTEQMKQFFRKSLYKTMICYILSKENALEVFNGKLFNYRIDRYRRLNAQFEELVRLELFARLAARIPWFTQEAVQNSEVGILQKNIRNNARGISLRKLFDQIPALLARMCPCMLMSPISVAQFIDPEAEKFDLVIFDEASQMPTYEAVGAIARGKNVIIVGDPKQMPPTNFFAAHATDEDWVEMEDLESILDDCLALSIPSKYLLWHYRSKHESLIAFSNSEYYDNKLLTFPSPDNIESKVRIEYVDGYYDKGRSRQNKKEAEAVVMEIVRRLQDEELCKKSIGVVTFSIAQQSLIEDLLAEVFGRQPELEPLALERKEPLFVKNLENVQGDERDVILFSVGYGPDASGRISMNFGPLNRNGGERRLNVAVSRARYEMVVFSTLRSEQLDLNRTAAVGVAGLKRFLEYAERGTRLVSDKQITRTADEQVSIANLVGERLRALGYVVHTNIGVSGYKVDIGIVDPLRPSTYRLGILCDGKNYHRAKTVRDREIVQTTVLQRLGWDIYRIWTLDWWEHADSILEEIQDILEGRKKVQKMKHLDRKVVKVKPIKTVHDLPEKVKKCYAYEEGQEQPVPQTYNVTRLKQYGRYDPDLLYEPNSRIILEGQVQKILATEAPISRTLLFKKVLYEWGLSRLSPKSEAFLKKLLEDMKVYQTVHEGLAFCWRSESMCLHYNEYRPESDREPVDLPPEEVANGLRQILNESVSLQVFDLIRAGGVLFGFPHKKGAVDAAMQRGLDEAVRQKYVKVENDRVSLL